MVGVGVRVIYRERDRVRVRVAGDRIWVRGSRVKHCLPRRWPGRQCYSAGGPDAPL